ncbi:hypothetical protein pgond44_14018 [Psychroflexus gondwanensis ACAM 44]|uniref:Uncharacterized protein n=1 Tax=Psychroflexus gondwanensis ACAM 44 TaxID=1189619 RepID=N1WIG2_9FLAO|nr:hypothetical protein [Psychroflexus gondwanensis]EMY80026.1 hypothetical protein pgond44_14018 [Psychroflexus gondwanensis ACAM 44]
MKQLIILFITIIFLVPQNSKAQDDGAIIAAAGGLLAIGSGIAAVQQMKEQAELTATEWFLTNYPNQNRFSLKTLDFDGKKLKDISATSVISFKIQEFDIVDNNPELGKKYVLFGFTSFGWINEYGINFDKVIWILIDGDEWMNMMTSYSKVASGEKNEEIIREALKEGKVVNRGIRAKKGKDIDFYKIEGDMYLVTDYSPDMKFIYNERSFGIYLKETMNLIQIGRGDLIEIHEYFFDE